MGNCNQLSVTREEIPLIVKETLVQLGIDASNTEAVIAFQQDMAYLRTIRTNTESFKKAGWVTLSTIFIGMILAALKWH